MFDVEKLQAIVDELSHAEGALIASWMESKHTHGRQSALCQQALHRLTLNKIVWTHLSLAATYRDNFSWVCAELDRLWQIETHDQCRAFLKDVISKVNLAKESAIPAPALYRVAVDGDVMTVDFIHLAKNADILKELVMTLNNLRTSGMLASGPLLKITGYHSSLIMATLTHAVAHMYSAIAIWDSKVQRFIVTISHDSRYAIGDEIE